RSARDAAGRASADGVFRLNAHGPPQFPQPAMKDSQRRAVSIIVLEAVCWLAGVRYVVVAQAADPQKALAFEVASIKRNRSGSDMAEGGSQPGGRVNARNVTLVNLIVMAFTMPPDRIEGGPSWVSTDRFDVAAVGNRNASVADTRQMMR